MKELYLIAGDVNLEYRSGKLRWIHLKTNKVIELKGNGLLESDNVKNLTTICLIKGKKVLKVEVENVEVLFRQKANDGELAKLVVDSEWTRLNIMNGLK